MDDSGEASASKQKAMDSEGAGAAAKDDLPYSCRDMRLRCPMIAHKHMHTGSGDEVEKTWPSTTTLKYVGFFSPTER